MAIEANNNGYLQKSEALEFLGLAAWLITAMFSEIWSTISRLGGRFKFRGSYIAKLN
jgi:hypothetical protein